MEGIDLHQFFTNTAFKDHDYNVIFDKGTNKKYVIDPIFSASFGIRDVTEQFCNRAANELSYYTFQKRLNSFKFTNTPKWLLLPAK